MFSAFAVPKAPGEAPDSPAEGAYAAFGVPWIKDDIHKTIKSLSPEAVQELADADLPETFARFNGSPYFRGCLKRYSVLKGTISPSAKLKVA
jgi:hypothetical protein